MKLVNILAVLLSIMFMTINSYGQLNPDSGETGDGKEERNFTQTITITAP